MNLSRHSLFVKALGIRVANASEVVHPDKQHSVRPVHDSQSNRYSGIPVVPAEIGYRSGGKDAGKKQKGKFATVMEHNPLVVIGCGLTTAALVGVIYNSFVGNKHGTQKYMQYRIMAQFFTVTALVAGVTLFSTYTPTKTHQD